MFLRVYGGCVVRCVELMRRVWSEVYLPMMVLQKRMCMRRVWSRVYQIMVMKYGMKLLKKVCFDVYRGAAIRSIV